MIVLGRSYHKCQDMKVKKLTEGTALFHILRKEYQCQISGILFLGGLTRSNDGHVNQDMQPNLPIENGGPEMSRLEMLLFSNGRVIIFLIKSLIPSHNEIGRGKIPTFAPDHESTFFRGQKCCSSREIDQH